MPCPLTDACELRQVVELKPDWPKGYSRLGAAHQGLKEWDQAATAYEKGVACFLCALVHRPFPAHFERLYFCAPSNCIRRGGNAFIAL